MVFADNSVLSDENIDLVVEINHTRISDAYEKSNAILVDLQEGVDVVVNCSIIGEDTVTLDFLEITILFAEFDTFSNIHELEFDLYPGENASFYSSWAFSNNMSVGDFDLIGGIFEVRYDLYYTINGIHRTLIGQPFYLQVSENPILTGTGIATSLGLALTGISAIRTIKNMSSSIPSQVNSSLEESLLRSTKKLHGTYEGKFAKSIQNEVSNAAFTYVKSNGFEKCPKCEVTWPEGNENCPECKIPFSEAEALCSERLRDRSLSTCEELVNSASALSLNSIAAKIGQGVMPTTAITSVLIGSGLAIAKPRLGKNWNKRTRRLFFKGIQTAVFVIFWVQSMGMDAVSLTTMGIVMLTGAIPAMIISKIVEYIILARAKVVMKIGN